MSQTLQVIKTYTADFCFRKDGGDVLFPIPPTKYN